MVMSGDGKTKRLTRVYIEGKLPTLEKWQLPDEIAHYVTRVLRCRAGEHIICFSDDGREGEFILLPSEKAQAVWVESCGPIRKAVQTSTLQIHVACSLSKGSKLDDVIRRISELGASSFTPLMSI